MSKRKSLSTKERLRLFNLHAGRCHLCLGLIDGTREAWEISHDRPLEMGGADDDANRLPAHKKCHRTHTATVDLPQIAKAKRREAKHVGAKAPSSRPISVPHKVKREPRALAAALPPLRPRVLFK